MLVALSGLSGAGKSTAIAYLEKRGVGKRYYAGSIVHEEIARRGLDLTPETERLVRSELRATYGMAVFAERAVPQLLDCCSRHRVLLDSLYCPAELDCYRSTFDARLAVVAVTASFETRASRLAQRPERPLSREKLASRDEFERDVLNIGAVIDGADYRVDNEAALDEFKKSLDTLIGQFA